MEHKGKLQRTFVREEAYLILRDWIIEGKLESGQKLRDKDLAEQLGVSRTPIREALLRLENEGFVLTKPNCSTVVSPIDFHNALHLYSIVWSLEKLALEQAFEFITDKHITLMSSANEKFLQALQSNHPALSVECDSDFHSIYIQLSQNNELCQILSRIKQKLKRLELHYFKKAKAPHLSYQEHAHIIEALKHKDLLLALHTVESNWKASFSRMSPNSEKDL